MPAPAPARQQSGPSTRLAERVLAALGELLRGFSAADRAADGRLLGEVPSRDPGHVHGGLVATLLRLVFILYAEDRGLLPAEPLYVRSYSASALFEMLRAESERHPHEMVSRFGAWGRLLSLFRLVHDGGQVGTIRLPPRRGRLFDPDAYPFLEGRPWRAKRAPGETIDPPKVPDGAVLRVLESLLLVGGERIAYRTLEVEHLGSVYEAVMGFTVQGTALAPTEQRRRSGSHYTPRALVEPIVDRTLRPLLEDLGPCPTPEQILDIKVCDPAMGSGAFLVAACRWLGDALVESFRRHGMPPLAPFEDPVLHARRLVAQRCLYGVDKDRFAVELAKLSLWLVTLAQDHPFSFIDHSLRQGDSLVGLGREQIASFHWAPSGQATLVRKTLDAAIERARVLRARIHALSDSDDTPEKERLLEEADEALGTVRKVGNLVVEAFFRGKTPREREAVLARFRDHLELHGLERLPDTPEADRLMPFHWEIELPEVFVPGAAPAATRTVP